MRPKLHEWEGGHCHWCKDKCDNTLHHAYWKGFCKGRKERLIEVPDKPMVPHGAPIKLKKYKRDK